MNLEIIIPLLITTCVAIIGWIVGHNYNSSRDFQNKRHEIQIKYLIESYRRLESGASRGNICGSNYGGNFESAIADIQLLGSNKQAKMAKELAEDIASNNTRASTGPLLMSLRNTLRTELKLNKIDEEPVHFRLSSKS